MAFSLSPAAANVIRHRIETSSVDRPIAMMIDCSDSLPVSRELDAAVLRKASQAELRDIAKREYSLDKLEFRLNVPIYSKSQYPSWMYATIDGVQFVLPFWMRLALRNWTLDFVNDRFLLRSRDQVRYTLSGAKRRNNAA
jgi:hypothetical protein